MLLHLRALVCCFAVGAKRKMPILRHGGLRITFKKDHVDG